MTVALYLASLVLGVVTASLGLTVVAAVCMVICLMLMFRHEAVAVRRKLAADKPKHRPRQV